MRHAPISPQLFTENRERLSKLLPGIDVPAEKLGVRLEDTVLITRNGPQSLMADIPMEAGDIEALMARGKPKRR